MRPIFKYKDNFYSYAVVNCKVIPFKIAEKIPEDEFEFSVEMRKQIEIEFAEYEATLNEDELKIWWEKK